MRLFWGAHKKGAKGSAGHQWQPELPTPYTSVHGTRHGPVTALAYSTESACTKPGGSMAKKKKPITPRRQARQARQAPDLQEYASQGSSKCHHKFGVDL
jgi:hypothetical protein